ncbi:MAG: hypothetical protein MUF36_10180 [Bacteroidales bacterium]|jgi:hypothetical protein|nr:hypothetical protein [Bacteroidales bacterium]
MKDLKDIADKNPFKVPENYFEEVNRKIIASNAGKVNETKPEGIYRRLKPFLAVAASVAVLILLSYTALKIFRPSDITGKLPEISLQEFSDTYLNDIDILTLEEGIPAVASYDGVHEVSNAEIIDYLIVENIDLNEIYEIL